MAIYWFLFGLPLAALLMPVRLRSPDLRVAWFAVWVVLTLVLGLRHEIGGDWTAYVGHLEDAERRSLAEALAVEDPGFSLMNWIITRLGGGIYLFNTICGGVLSAGIVHFCRRQPLPWLALLAAVPYVITVVGMGYTRQGVALGLEMFAITALAENRLRRFLILVLFAAIFHKSAALLLPIAALVASRNRAWTMLWVAVTAGAMFFFLVLESFESLWYHYVEQQMQSEGGFVRVVMNAVPALVLLLYRNKLAPERDEKRLWVAFAVLALACVPLVLLASTAVDRVALYLIPIQMYVFSRIHRLAASPGIRTAVTLGVVTYYAAAYWIWLNYALHAHAWVPYRFIPLV